MAKRRTILILFFPGDMFMPVETFDFIPILFKNVKEGQLPKGSSYDILLEVMPVGGVKGNKAQAFILFINNYFKKTLVIS